jgi:cyclophilin family peptidyl-prolyl cis-trans isomerase
MKTISFRILLLAFMLQLPIFFSERSFADSLPFVLPNRSELASLRSALITTNKGDLYFELFPEEAPIHVANFKYRADKGFYRGTSFTHYFENYIIQGGRGFARGVDQLKYSLQPEFTERKHVRGVLGMARWEDVLNPQRRSSSKEFHLLLSEAKHMNGSYTIFGLLIRGWKVLDSLKEGDVIQEVKVFVRPQVMTSIDKPK